MPSNFSQFVDVVYFHDEVKLSEFHCVAIAPDRLHLTYMLLVGSASDLLFEIYIALWSQQ